MTEQEILDTYSTPGLKVNQLTRPQKKEHLLSQGVPRSGVEEILNRIYAHTSPMALIGVYNPQPVASVQTAKEQAKAQGFEGQVCNTCGSFNTRRGGTCLTCSDCGSTTGCG